MRNLLIFLLALWGIWWIRRAIRRAGEGRAAGGEKAGKTRRRVEHMVECAHCGVHVPESEGVRDGERFFCSEAHRLAGPRKRD
ncbi:PP0621 family protein [Thauera sinica]|uniref:PP0621 family protein n=1 Tax=Thauera sinica TaxID=2665146 RepID=A0ABW1AXZ5_9RHOO|nr:PP0621 family protein [Thauera sp. K11]ATE60954.1 hypothetical protein CCZ27_14285 [Thauera sp. K11]